MIGFFLAAVTLGLLVYAGQLVSAAVQDRMSAESDPPQIREREFAVNLRRAEAETVAPVLEAFGTVAARRTLEVRAAVGGRILSLAEDFEEGGRFRAGEVIAVIDPADMQSMVDRLTADLADAQAEVRDAERSLELARAEENSAVAQSVLRETALQRQIDLAARGVGTAATVETAKFEVAAAQATVISRRQAVAQAEARVDQAATRLSRAQIEVDDSARDLADTVVRAPFAGTISNTAVVEGGLVGANERLADLVDAEDLEVSFRVSTAQYSRLLDGQGDLVDAPVTAMLEVTGVDLIAQGIVSRVGAGMEAGQTGRLVFARLFHAPGFRPGDFVKVEIKEPPLDNVVRLPASALGADGQVLVLAEGNRLEALDVRLLRRQDDDVLLQGAGLAGREIVEARSPLLGAGILVRPIRPDRNEAAAEPEMLELSAERRAKLVAFIEASARMPKGDKARMLAQLAEPQVPAQVVARIESRMGG